MNVFGLAMGALTTLRMRAFVQKQHQDTIRLQTRMPKQSVLSLLILLGQAVQDWIPWMNVGLAMGALTTLRMRAFVQKQHQDTIRLQTRMPEQSVLSLLILLGQAVQDWIPWMNVGLAMGALTTLRMRAFVQKQHQDTIRLQTRMPEQSVLSLLILLGQAVQDWIP